MTNPEPRDAGIALLRAVAESMGARRAQGEHLNAHELARAASAARWAACTELERKLTDWLAEIPAARLLHGVITNASIPDPEVLRPRVPLPLAYDEPTRAEIGRKIPFHDDYEVAKDEGREAAALEAAPDDYVKECLLAAMAFDGSGREALQFAVASGIAARRATTLPILRIVTTVERARARHPEWNEFLPAIVGERERLDVARGLLGLVPWDGYPVADY